MPAGVRSKGAFLPTLLPKSFRQLHARPEPCTFGTRTAFIQNAQPIDRDDEKFVRLNVVVEVKLGAIREPCEPQDVVRVVVADLLHLDRGLVRCARIVRHASGHCYQHCCQRDGRIRRPGMRSDLCLKQAPNAAERRARASLRVVGLVLDVGQLAAGEVPSPRPPALC
jgi:hypothetical protein